MEKACDTPLRDMLDEVALDLKNNYVSEVGTKQSFNYDVSNIDHLSFSHHRRIITFFFQVRHFYKKLYFNPGYYLDSNQHWKVSSSLLDADYRRTRSMSESVCSKKPC